MKDYNHLQIEKKWQEKWTKKKVFEAKNGSKKKKFYSLIEFPYPSGDGLHVGHPRPYIGMDVISRKRRMEGYNVLYPIGWDAFGLPTENYAIKTGLHPEVVTKRNTDNFKRQIKQLGISFDWSREINTTDPKYYKWTQWIFLQFLKHGLAYKAKMAINWCPKDKIGLANEEVVGGSCERCGTKVEKREKEQWMLRITKYADRLDKDLDTVDYLPQIKLQQRNWIGKSEGAEIEFRIKNNKYGIKIFTTRPDTIFGATYVVISPEHELVKQFWLQIKNKEEVEEYIKKTKDKTEIERTAEEKDLPAGQAGKTGVELKGVKAINPATKEEIPIWIADYVLASYGTGAIMAVPAHDERDFTFAKKYNLPIKEVIIPKVIDKHDPPMERKKTVERKMIQVVVINPKNNKILVLKWKKFPWTTFITGGIDEDEDIIEAAKREIIEETGYENVKFTRHLGGLIESHYYANHKGENRKALFYDMIFELTDEKRKEISDEEKSIHEVKWVTWEELNKDTNLKNSEYDIILDRFFNPPHAWTDEGILRDSGKFSGMESRAVKKEITKFIGGKIVTKYKLRDWVFSRQRYWGEPIPVVHCSKCGIVPLPERELPLKLPKVAKYQPTDTGESPLASITKWINVKCPKCKGNARRETDTMPQWAGSSWYFLRYIDPKNGKEFADSKKLKYWTPVDWYNGGMEHTTLHLLYSRFWNKFLYDIGLVPASEPYEKRTSHGLILAKGGEKMSKSRGNVINPDDIVKTFGADTLRMYEMFMGPFDEAIVWGDENILGVRRFLEKVWNVTSKIENGLKHDSKFENILHKTIKKVSDDIEIMAFNTAVSSMMILVNEMEKQEKINRYDFEMFLKLLSPFAPHVTEEIWHMLGNKKFIVEEKWPKADLNKMKNTEVTITLQVNNKIRALCKVVPGISEQEVLKIAKSIPEFNKWFVGKEIKKTIFVKDKLINIVV